MRSRLLLSNHRYKNIHLIKNCRINFLLIIYWKRSKCNWTALPCQAVQLLVYFNDIMTAFSSFSQPQLAFRCGLFWFLLHHLEPASLFCKIVVRTGWSRWSSAFETIFRFRDSNGNLAKETNHSNEVCPYSIWQTIT